MADRVALEARRAERLLLLEQARVALEDAGHAVEVARERRVGELRLDAGEVGLERRDVRAGVADRLAYRALVAGDELGEVGDDRAAPQGDRARVGRVGAGEQAQQRRLPGAVRADQADPGAGRKVEVEAVEDPPAAERLHDPARAQRGRGGGGGHGHDGTVRTAARPRGADTHTPVR